jgi:serine/threonine protein phosphatase PrpC
MSKSSDTVEMETLGPPPGLDRPPLLSALARVDVAGLSDRGKVRPNNEDHFYVARFGRFLEALCTNLPADEMPPRFDETGYAAIVADGIGGSSGGEVASKLAISTLINLALGAPDWILRLDGNAIAQKLQRRFQERFDQIRAVMAERASADPRLHGFGTTMTMALSLGPALFVIHIGDSRAYLLRQHQLHQLTRDHTIAQALAEQGLLAPQEAATSRMRHVLTKSLGAQAGYAEPDAQEVALQDGDCLLLCTDGLTDMVKDEKIVQILAGGDSAEKACRCLIDEALAAGGKDNVTAVVARYGFPAAG